MSASLEPVPLSHVIGRLARRVGNECASVLQLARARVRSNDAQRQYVRDGEPELYQRKHERELALDVCEELADAVAYLAPLSEINDDYAIAVHHIARAYNLVEAIGWRKDRG